MLVKNKRIKSTGYNGSEPGAPHCEDVGCLMVDGHCKRTTHAESNAIWEAHPDDLIDATLYCTHMPCTLCRGEIINTRIKEVVYITPYGDIESAHNYLERDSIACRQFALK